MKAESKAFAHEIRILIDDMNDLSRFDMSESTRRQFKSKLDLAKFIFEMACDPDLSKDVYKSKMGESTGKP